MYKLPTEQEIDTSFIDATYYNSAHPLWNDIPLKIRRADPLEVNGYGHAVAYYDLTNPTKFVNHDIISWGFKSTAGRYVRCSLCRDSIIVLPPDIPTLLCYGMVQLLKSGK